MADRPDHADRARALLNAATPGPWQWRSFSGDVVHLNDGLPTLVAALFNRSDRDQREHDAELIAAAPDLIAGLLAERDELRRQLDTLRNAIEKLISWAESYRMHHVVIALRELLDPYSSPELMDHHRSLLATLAPAARQLADAQDEVQRLRTVLDRLLDAIAQHENEHRPTGPHGKPDMDPWHCCIDDRVLWDAAAAAAREGTT